jgi:hypothetical protein
MKKKRVIKYNSRPTDKVITGDSGAEIVLGKDRVAGPETGYGAFQGDTSEVIDLVVGRGASLPESVKTDAVSANMDLDADAARIYISSKTDIDNNAKIAEGSGNVKKASAILLKADALRFHSRKNMKLVTYGSVTSDGQTNQELLGIELIAGNNDKELQPMIKGDNLKQYLESLMDHINFLNDRVNSLENFITNFIQTDYSSHTHGTAVGPTTPHLLVPKTLAVNLKYITESLKNQQTFIENGVKIKINGLKPGSKLYICSLYNKNN